MTEVTEERKKANAGATDLVNATLNEKKRKLTETIETDTAELNTKKKKWDHSLAIWKKR